MALSSIQLEAFHEVARTLNFSQAAKNLHITQSALSQRIINLEGELELSLFVRESSGVRLTDTGETLLRHCQTRSGLEQELLQHLGRGKSREIGGTLRIGGFSSVMRSVIIPSMSELVRRHSSVQVELSVRELRDLPQLLKRGEIDYAIVDQELPRTDLASHILGEEEYVLVESSRVEAREGIYLDHDADDLTTELFFRKQGKKFQLSQVRRSFLDDIDGLIEGAALGWGRAVLPRHLIESRKDLRVVPRFKSVRSPVVLHYYLQPYYSKLHDAVLAALLKECPKRL